MAVTGLWRNNRAVLIVLVLLVLLSVVAWSAMGQRPFVRTMLSGLTLGALYFMVAAGLTLIFGLMDVLNFAHGAMFMVGAYTGWQFYTNPTFLFGLAPLALACLSGLSAAPLLQPVLVIRVLPERWQPQLPRILLVVSLLMLVLAVAGLDVVDLAETAMVAIMVAADPLAEATPQESLSRFGLRVLLMLAVGLALAVAQARPGDKTRAVSRQSATRSWALLPTLLALTVVATLLREPASLGVLKMNADLRFLLSLLVGAVVGGGLGAVLELSLIRPLYVRPQFIVLLTLGLAFVLKEMAQVLWDPLAYQMSRPPLFSQPGKAENIWAWFSGRNLTVDVLGVTFPSYRLFIIVLGVLMLVGLWLLMSRSRLGMIIRAGVQDREMVEALGINVRRVFTLVFSLGAGLAALGGIGAAPFIPVEPGMGDRFMMQGFITVVLGGMGSYSGAAIGALLLGLARAFGDYLALRFSLSPAISEASTVIIMAIVLLVRPSGLLGKKE
jgi:branched-chain amino acid transport system permease protein